VPRLCDKAAANNDDDEDDEAETRAEGEADVVGLSVRGTLTQNK